MSSSNIPGQRDSYSQMAPSGSSTSLLIGLLVAGLPAVGLWAPSGSSISSSIGLSAVGLSASLSVGVGLFFCIDGRKNLLD